MSNLRSTSVAVRWRADSGSGKAALPLEVHSVARAVIDPHLRDALARRLDVARIAGRQPLDPDQHTGAGAGAGADVAHPSSHLDMHTGLRVHGWHLF